MRRYYKLRRFLEKGVKEFDNKKGFVSIETSLNKEESDFVKNLFTYYPSQFGHWEVHYCSICRGYDENKPYHLELVHDN